MKNYERYPGENCINPTPPPGASVKLPSDLETDLSEIPAMPPAPATPKFTPVYAPAFYSTRTQIMASQEPLPLRWESAQPRSV